MEESLENELRLGAEALTALEALVEIHRDRGTLPDDGSVDRTLSAVEDLVTKLATSSIACVRSYKE